MSKLIGMQPRSIVEQGVHAYLRELLLVLADTLMATEIAELVGTRYSHDADRTHSRWGSQPGSVKLLEQKTPITKPRVRLAGPDGTEVELQTYRALNDTDILSEQAGAKLLSGVSTRRLKETVETLVDGHGMGRQTISRRGVADMTRKLQEFRSRALEGIDVLVVFIDGIHLADTTYVVAVGIDASGKKHVLDFEPGSTESSGVCRALMSNLIERHILSETGGHLFVIDGGKGLRKAVRDVFGKRVNVQRCTQHKIRNVEDKLPKSEQQEFRHKFSAAYSKTTFKEAETAFDNLRRDLELRRRYAAAKSLLEGLPEVLTLHRLGIQGMLRRTLCTTNIIESMFSSARYYTRNVKRWQNEDQMDRWIAAGLLEAEKNLRAVPGHTQLKKLKQTLLDA
jgi:putative transposase